MTAPTLTGLAPSITFAENTVNTTPQVIDSDVTFSDAEGNFNGGALTVSGLLAEDRVSILSGAVISLVAGVVYYDADGVGGAAAVAIGTASGGVGATFTVTFNASATSAAIDANAILAGDQAFTFVSNFSGVAGQATLKFISGKSILQLDVDGDRKADLLVEINGNVTGTTGNLYTGGGDVNGGWVL